MPENLTRDADGLCWTDWSPCTVSCVPQAAAYFARQWRKQIACESLGGQYSLARELAVISANVTNEEHVSASFRPCAYKLPICQQAPDFPSVKFNNLVYMRMLVLGLASLFVLIPTLIVCIKYRRHAHPFVWLNQHAASLRDLTERSETIRSTKTLDLKTLTPGAIVIPSNAVTTTHTTTTVTSGESKSKLERKGKAVKRNTEWSKVGKSVVQEKVVSPTRPESPVPFESVSAHEVFTTVNVESQVTKDSVIPAPSPAINNNVNTTNSVDRDEKTQDGKTNDGTPDETAAAARKTKSQDNHQELKSFTQQDKSTNNDVAPQLEGPLVKSDVGARMEEKIDLGDKKEARKPLKEEEPMMKLDETQGTPTKEGP